MNILATICARAGSKRVKNKNIRNLADKPLITYTIVLAKKWNKVNKIICSTDSKDIAQIAKNNGIEVPFIRPKELAKDNTGKIDVIRHALKKSEEIYKEKFDLIVDLDVSSPIRTVNDLNECLKIFKDKKPDILFSVTKARRNPYFNMIELNKKGYAELCKTTKKTILRSQDAPKVYDLNASIYFYDRLFLLDSNNIHPLYSKKAAIYIMDDIAAFDIDTETDLKFIDFLIKNKEIIL